MNVKEIIHQSYERSRRILDEKFKNSDLNYHEKGAIKIDGVHELESVGLKPYLVVVYDEGEMSRIFQLKNIDHFIFNSSSGVKLKDGVTAKFFIDVDVLWGIEQYWVSLQLIEKCANSKRFDVEFYEQHDFPYPEYLV